LGRRIGADSASPWYYLILHLGDVFSSLAFFL
jgi:hypothetical protein